MLSNQPTNVVIAGLGGQGVIKASDILADVAFNSGVDVKKSELHGMSQRGGFSYCDLAGSGTGQCSGTQSGRHSD
jgi:Pyruvate/2-oxoacid:ferredoxin oxidoreductase gamma subunit